MAHPSFPSTKIKSSSRVSSSTNATTPTTEVVQRNICPICQEISPSLVCHGCISDILFYPRQRLGAKRAAVREMTEETTRLLLDKAQVFTADQKVIKAVREMDKTRDEALRVSKQ